MSYSVVIEDAAGGGFTAWVNELPGCFARAATREQVEAKLPTAIRDFLCWRKRHGDAVEPEGVAFRIVSSEVTSANAVDGDTTILLEADRTPLTERDWHRTERWLEDSREELLAFLRGVQDAPLDWTPEGSPRSLKQNVFHLAMVEIMYAVWTFDLQSAPGLTEFLAWTRCVASDRIRSLAEQSDDRVTAAEWAGASEPEEWTARKAARRLLWHERLHLRSLERRFHRELDDDANRK